MLLGAYLVADLCRAVGWGRSRQQGLTYTYLGRIGHFEKNCVGPAEKAKTFDARLNGGGLVGTKLRTVSPVSRSVQNIQQRRLSYAYFRVDEGLRLRELQS